jgi:hypothetical protein
VLIQINVGISEWCIGHIGHQLKGSAAAYGDVMMKRVTVAALSLLATITPAITQPAEVVQMFDCSAFTHIVWACLPPSSARDNADGMASAFMSAAIRLGREHHISYDKLNAAAMAALQRQRAMTGNNCRLDVLVRNYGKLCDALIETNKLVTKPTVAGAALGAMSNL